MKGYDTAAKVSATQARALKSQGYDFAIRYLVPQTYSKALTKAEAAALSSSGLLIGCVWETTASRARSGAAAGLADGAQAKKCAQDVGMPEEATIYFAVDYDAQSADFDSIAAYLIAAATMCRPYSAGVYGSFGVVEDMHRRELGLKLWQCVAWSGGKVSEHLQLYQKEWNVRTGVVTVDNNYTDTPEACGFWQSEGEPMFYSFVPERMGIYHNRDRKTIETIKSEMGADVVCNLNLFNWSDWSGASYTRAEGKVVGSDGYSYYGFGFDAQDKTLSRGWSSADKHLNFFGCWDLIVSGEVTQATVPAWTAGLRRRTVIGTLTDGKIFIYANEYLENVDKLCSNLLSVGAVDAIVLDGGGSTQAITPDGKLISSDNPPRRVHTLFWARLPKAVACPYPMPTKVVRLLTTGEAARWAQWMLNQYGYRLTVDGIFGPKSVSALKDFQELHGLTVDGICGAQTRKALSIYLN